MLVFVEDCLTTVGQSFYVECTRANQRLQVQLGSREESGSQFVAL